MQMRYRPSQLHRLHSLAVPVRETEARKLIFEMEAVYAYRLHCIDYGVPAGTERR